MPIRGTTSQYLFYFLRTSTVRYKISTTEPKTSGKTAIKRILMVDDEPDITFTIKTMLENTGSFQVETFTDPASALSRFNTGVYDLALLDIRMPKMNGFQLCRKLRDIDNKLKVCFLTATDPAYYKEEGSDIIDELGINCFITKPLENEEIAEKIKAILSQR